MKMKNPEMIIKLWRKEGKVFTSYCHHSALKMQLNILIKQRRESLSSAAPAAKPVEHDKGKLTSNYTISLIIHNEVFDVSSKVDIFSAPSFFRRFFLFHLIMLQTRGEYKGKTSLLFSYLLRN